MALRRPAARARAAWRRPPPRRWVPGLPGWVPAVCRTSLTAGVASLQAEPPVLAEDVRRWLQAEGADPGDPAAGPGRAWPGGYGGARRPAPGRAEGAEGGDGR